MLFQDHEGSRSALDDGTRKRTFAELEDRIARLGAVIRGSLGVEESGHVALLTPNRIEGVELVIAAMAHGVWLTPVNQHLAPEEIGYVLEDSGARVLFVDASMRAKVPPDFHGRVIELDELDARVAEVAPRAIDFDAAPGSTMVYTSGTSGRPKGVKRARPATIREALKAWRDGGRSFGFDGQGPHLVTGPLYHAAPLLFAVYDLLNGSEVIVMPRWDERAFLRTVTERAVRHTHLVPTMMVRLLRLPDEERAAFDPSGLTMVMHGAAPITPETKRAMLDWWGDCIVEYWGATEGGVYTLTDARTWRERPGTVGRATSAFEIYAIDDQDQRLPPGEEGTLVCRHARLPEPFVYHHDDAKTAASYRGPHVFTVGDLGWVDADGYVFLGERRSNLILSGGVNIYPAEIERVLAQHPDVSDVAVFGIPDAEWGERVHAAIELRQGVEASSAASDAILGYARERLGGYKLPRGIDFHEKLPRNEAGKMRVRDLRAPYWDGVPGGPRS